MSYMTSMTSYFPYTMQASLLNNSTQSASTFSTNNARYTSAKGSCLQEEKTDGCQRLQSTPKDNVVDLKDAGVLLAALKTTSLIGRCVAPRMKLILSPMVRITRQGSLRQQETLVDAGRQFATHFTRRSRELFDHLSKTDDCRAISPLSSSPKFSVSSPPSHSGLAKAITTRCSQMSDMLALLSLTFSRRRLMKF